MKTRNLWQIQSGQYTTSQQICRQTGILAVCRQLFGKTYAEVLNILQQLEG